MNSSAAYLDASAFVKLLVDEPESDALEAFLRGRSLTSSGLLRTEARRAVRHLGIDAVEHVGSALSAVMLIDAGDEILDRAGMLDPRIMRNLNAIHLATALDVGRDLAVIVTYDDRMQRGASLLDLPVESPS